MTIRDFRTYPLTYPGSENLHVDAKIPGATVLISRAGCPFFSPTTGDIHGRLRQQSV